MINYVFDILMAMLVALSLLPLIPSKYWWIRGVEFVRLQIICLQVAVVGLFMLISYPWAFFDYLVLSLISSAILYQLVIILPHTRFAKKQVKNASLSEKNTVTLLHANVLMTNKKTEDCLSMIKQCNPDIVLLVETDEFWQTNLHALEADYPQKLYCPQDNTFGMMLYSKFPFTQHQIDYLVKQHVPSFLVGIQLPTKTGETLELRLSCIHPEPPAPSACDYTEVSSKPRDKELDILAKNLQKNTKPYIVMGDLNDVAWSRSTKRFQKISGLLDPRRGRGLYNTFHASHWWLRYPLDHLFHTEHFKVRKIERLPHFGSDHFPLLIQLAY